MEDGFELFHIPQQSRRDKLRVLSQDNPNSDQNLLTCISNSNLNHASCSSSPSLVNFSGTYDTTDSNSGFINTSTINSSASSSYNHHRQPYPATLLPKSSTVHNNSTFLGCSTTSQPHQRVVFDQSFNGGDMVNFKTGSSLPSLNNHRHHDNLMLGHGLSLSLSNNQKTNHHEQNLLPSTVKPFAGYAMVLKGSNYLKPAKLLLEEFCDVSSSHKSNLLDQDCSLMESPEVVEDRFHSSNDQNEHRHWRRTRLLSILDEVYLRYKQYYQQVLSVVGAFESVTGLENAAPSIRFSLNAMSKHFRLLKNMIAGQLRFSSKSIGEGSTAKRSLAPTVGTIQKGVLNYTQVQDFGMDEHHVWRPQRGLPQRAVAVLRAWLFEHFLHPYPTDTDKQMLAKQTGLSRSQVSNWFINARVRLWKPMVEEVHTLETLQTNKRPYPSVEGQVRQVR